MDDVRNDYRKLSDQENEKIKGIKDAGQALIDKIRSLDAGSREMSLAITKAEESVMWAVKHVTK